MVVHTSYMAGADFKTFGRCCIMAVNSLNLLHFQVFAEIRKLLKSCVFLGIIQQRLPFTYHHNKEKPIND